VCVDTPESRNGKAELGQVKAVLKDLARYLPKKHVVVIKSTVPPGSTVGEFQEIFSDRKDLHLAMSPEFLREGSALKDSLEPDRIVLGVQSDFAFKVLRDIYRVFLDAEIVRTNPTEAELCKYANNALLAMLISYSNELAAVA